MGDVLHRVIPSARATQDTETLGLDGEGGGFSMAAAGVRMSSHDFGRDDGALTQELAGSVGPVGPEAL